MILTTPENINWRIFLSTRKYLLATIGAILTILLLVVLIMLPQINESWELYQKLQAEKPRLERLQLKIVELDNIQFSPEFLQIQVVSEALPSNKPLLELLTSLNSVSSATNVIIKEFQLSPGLVATEAAELIAKSKSREDVDSLEVSMSLVGTFGNMQEFLILVEKATPFTTITSLTLTVPSREFLSDPEVLAEQTINAVIKTKTYFFIQPISVTIESPLPRLTTKDQEVLAELAEFKLIDFPVQTEISGGLEDLFGVDFNLLDQILTFQEGLEL